MSNNDITIKVKESVSPNRTFIDQPTSNQMLVNFFNLNQAEITNKDRAKLEEIEDYISEHEDDMEKVMELKDMRFRLGKPQVGTKELDHFHRYIRIRNSMKQKEAELKALER